MNIGTEHIQIVNIALMGVTGLFSAGLGVGVEITVFKNQIEAIKVDVLKAKQDFVREITEMKDLINYIHDRQKRIRGEDNGIVPLFMTRPDCTSHIQLCSQRNSIELANHTREIKGNNNLADKYQGCASEYVKKRGMNLIDEQSLLIGE